MRVEAVPWARTRARHTRDFEDLVAFCAQQMAKTPITVLLRVGWETVGPQPLIALIYLCCTGLHINPPHR